MYLSKNLSNPKYFGDAMKYFITDPPKIKMLPYENEGGLLYCKNRRFVSDENRSLFILQKLKGLYYIKIEVFLYCKNQRSFML